MAEAIALDDDDGSDADVQIAAPSPRRPAAAASSSAVVDLTTAGASAAPHVAPRRRRRRAIDTNEVQFVGTAASAARHPPVHAAGGGPAVQFVGVKRPRPPGHPPVHRRGGFGGGGNASSLNRTSNHGAGGVAGNASFGRGGNRITLDQLLAGMGGRGGGGFGSLVGPSSRGPAFASAIMPLRPPSNNHFRGHPRNNPKKKRPMPTPKPAEPPAMTKGKALQRPQGFDAIDMYYPRLKANDRTAVLHNLLSNCHHSGRHTKKFVHDWRVQYERAHPKATLWSLARGLSEKLAQMGDAFDLDRKLPAKMMSEGVHQKENKPTCSNTSPASETSHDGKGALVKSNTKDASDEKPTASIGPLSGEILDTLGTFFVAHLGKASHKAMLEAIQPIESAESLTCGICSDDFDARDTVACCGEDIHFYCKPCLSSYCTVTVQSGPVQSMTCPMPNCKSLFATHDIKSILSEWDILMIEHREDSRDRRVALAAKAMLHCECGMVAVITEEDMGDGRIACPGTGCGRRYCAKCGNDDHGKEACPPPAETVQWLDANSKECPNCKNRIQKNGGCDHMTCQPPGGCGHEFWWTCGCPYRGQHKCGQRSGQPGTW